MNYSIKYPENNGGMNERIRRLQQQNLSTPTTLSIERALIETEFYKHNYGTMPIAVLRAKNFYEICKNQAAQKDLEISKGDFTGSCCAEVFLQE